MHAQNFNVYVSSPTIIHTNYILSYTLCNKLVYTVSDLQRKKYHVIIMDIVSCNDAMKCIHDASRSTVQYIARTKKFSTDRCQYTHSSNIIVYPYLLKRAKDS